MIVDVNDIEVGSDDFSKLPLLIRGAQPEFNNGRLCRFVFCKRYKQEIVVDFPVAPITRMIKSIKNEGL